MDALFFERWDCTEHLESSGDESPKILCFWECAMVSRPEPFQMVVAGNASKWSSAENVRLGLKAEQESDTGLAASMCQVPHVAHITASNPGSSTSLHTTSGSVGPAPNSGGGLCGCTLRHISEKTLRRMKTARAGRSASERP
ncbi:hypothetical protein JOQ06_023601, partial [Pogonophryne albipinna]